MPKTLFLSREVRRALKRGEPVVALESTIISHGMPYPQNLETARQVEAVIRENGAVPATIAIIAGLIKVGLNEEELQFMSTSKEIVKASRRDLPVIVGRKMNAATTVAATMICANLAGIRVFVTGGIGGVHRGAEKTFDISADLQELARTRVAVVCAGAKAILDLPLTMEYLETHGVPVLGFKTDEFPSFYYRESGLRVDHRLETEEEAAEILETKWKLGLKGGVVIGNPIPPSYALDRVEIEGFIQKALAEAESQHISGKAVTPFLLSKLGQMTEGKTLQSNIALIRNNAAVGARIAAAYSRLSHRSR